MNTSNPLIFAGLSLIALIALMAGCSGTIPSASEPASATAAPVRIVPVFIVPNCQVLAAECHCIWIEPWGYQAPAPAETSNKRLSGIAI